MFNQFILVVVVAGSLAGTWASGSQHTTYIELSELNLVCLPSVGGKSILRWKTKPTEFRAAGRHASVECSSLGSMTECEQFKSQLIQSHAPGTTIYYIVNQTHRQHCYPKTDCIYWTQETLKFEIEGAEFSNSERVR